MEKKKSGSKKISKPTRLIRFDWAIKTVLRSKKNFPILEGFLSELLKTDVHIKSLLESESNKDRYDDKSNRVDIMAELTDGEKVIIEVQCIRQWDFLHRMLFGTSKVISEHLIEGEAYGKLPRVISVNIVYFDLGEGQDYIYRGTTVFRGIHKDDVLVLKEKEKQFYAPKIDAVEQVFPEYYVLKVSAFDLRIRDTLDEWMYALKESEVKPEFKAKGIQEAGKKLDMLRLPDEQRFAYERHVGDNRDQQSMLHTYFYDGKLEGMQEEKQRADEAIEIERQKAEAKLEAERQKAEAEKRDIAQKMEVSGMDQKTIQTITGLETW